MKICIVQSWGFRTLDGSNLRVYFLIKELLKRNHELVILNASKEDAEVSKKLFGCASLYAGVEISRWDSSFKKLFTYSSFILKGRKVLKKVDCDIVFGISFLNTMVTIVHPTAKKIAMYVDLMSNYFRYEARGSIIGYVLYKIGSTLEDLTMKKSDSIITITESLKKLFNKKYWGKTYIIPDGVDTTIFNPFIEDRTEDIRSKYNIENKKVVGYFGAIDPCDGVQYMAEVAPLVIKQCPDIRFFIVGRGNYLEKVKETLKQNKTIDHFVFTGWIKNKDVPDYIRASDICVVPNVNDKSIAPLITYRLLEGMASGVSILCTDLPGIREIAKDDMVFFTNPEDTNRFAEDILKILKIPDEDKKRMAENCWNIIKELDWRRIAEKDADVVEADSNNRE